MVVMRPLEQLIPYARNARTHSDAQIAQIAASIKEFGWTNPVLLDGENGIIAGHGRVLGARKLGMAEVPCIELAHLGETQKRAYILADNKLAENAGWDVELLRLELQELQASDFDVSLAGFGDDELSALLADMTEGLTDPDEVPEAPAEPVSVLGDVWVLGKHRLMCGDSLSSADVASLLSGAKVQMVYTDPPYGVEIVSQDIAVGNRIAPGPALAKGKVGGDKAFGKVGSIHRGMKAQPIIKANTYAPIIGDDSIETAANAYRLCAELKPVPVMIFWGGNYYASALPDSSCWIVWDKDNGEAFFADAEIAWTNQKTAVRLFKHTWNGLIKASERREKRVHPTQKPVALAEWCFEKYGNEGDNVLDLFGGSASTLIACERTNRAGLLMELSPAYVDTAVTRWQNFTGLKGTLEADGRTFDEIAAKRIAKAA